VYVELICVVYLCDFAEQLGRSSTWSYIIWFTEVHSDDFRKCMMGSEEWLLFIIVMACPSRSFDEIMRPVIETRHWNP